jgi:predicted NAD/FAD-binding protein
MKIAVIGSGISGLIAAEDLRARHDVALFEAAPKLGGHTNTVDVELDGERLSVDTGFIVFNDRTYPNFSRRLAEWGVESRPSEMSFSVRCDSANMEYNGSSLNGLFVQRRNLFRPGFYRMIRDILRFNREATALATSTDDADETATVGEFLRRGRYSPQFAEHYLLPMGAAIWSCPLGVFADFPIRFIAVFYHHHGLLSLRDRPQWQVVTGGSRRYIEALIRRWNGDVRIRLSTPIVAVRRGLEGVDVKPLIGREERFDHVVFACHSDQALRLLSDASPTEREILSAFPYGKNLAVLHTDSALLPKRRGAWASWNYLLPDSAKRHSQPATLTYLMNRLQHIESKYCLCVTLNSGDQINAAHVLGRFEYEHPVFSAGRAGMQARHRELMNANRTSFCGAYWGNGFHEDGVASAMAVANAINSSSSPMTERCVAAGAASP